MLASLIATGVYDAAEDAEEPVSLAHARAHLRIDPSDSDENELITALIVAAREYCEDYTGILLVQRAGVESCDGFGRSITLSAWPIISIDAITYLDWSGVAQTIDASNWFAALQSRPVRLRPMIGGWGVGYSGAQGSGFPVSIAVTAGYASPADVPQTIKQAMLLLIQSWFDNRSAVEAGVRAAAIEVPFAVEALLRKHRRRSL